MQFLVYFIVLLITAGSVLFGVDWLQAPMSPMAASKYELRAAKQPVRPAVQQAATKPAETTGKQNVAEPAPVQAPPPTVATTALVTNPSEPVPIVVPEPVAAAPPAPKCDIEACERAYRSFTSIDCTYQPNDGPRRLCTRGTPPNASAAQSTAEPEARAQASCNISACSSAYLSFKASDCTYQPFDGPRRLCEK